MKSRRQRWKQWVRTRPPRARQVLRIVRPDRKYTLTTTGQVGHLVSVNENGTVTTSLSRPYSYRADVFLTVHTTLTWTVFGIDPRKLVMYKEDPRANEPREGGDDDPTEGEGYCANH